MAGPAPHDVLDRGDVPGWTDYQDVLAEVVARRLGVGAGALSTVFPGHGSSRSASLPERGACGPMRGVG